jgi:hypothetical protein
LLESYHGPRFRVPIVLDDNFKFKRVLLEKMNAKYGTYY